MEKLQRLLFWSLCTIFTIAVAWRVVYFHYDPARVHSAIPTGAIVVTEHFPQPGDWLALAGTSPVQAGLRALDVDPEKTIKTLSSPRMAHVLKTFLGRHVVAGYVSFAGERQRPALLIASWAGWRTQPLRWGLYARTLKRLGVQKIEIARGRQGWSYPLKKTGKSLSFTATQGVLLVCISEDPSVLRHMLSRVESEAPILPELAADAAKSEARHRAWYVFYRRGPAGYTKTALELNLETFDPTLVQGTVLGPTDLLNLPKASTPAPAAVIRATLSPTGGVAAATATAPAQATPTDTPAEDTLLAAQSWDDAFIARDLSDALDSAPAALLLLPLEDLDPLLRLCAGTANTAGVAALIRPYVDEESPLCLTVLDMRFAGTICGIRAPSLAMAVRLKDSGAANQAIAATLDRINANSHAGLIPQVLVATNATASLTLIRGANGGTYARLGPTEKPTFFCKGRWLILASNRSAAETLLPLPAGEPIVPDWAVKVRKGPEEERIFWVRLPAIRDVLTKTIALHDLMTYASDFKGLPALRNGLSAFKTVADHSDPLDTCRIRVSSRDERFEARFELSADTAVR